MHVEMGNRLHFFVHIIVAVVTLHIADGESMQSVAVVGETTTSATTAAAGKWNYNDEITASSLEWRGPTNVVALTTVPSSIADAEQNTIPLSIKDVNIQNVGQQSGTSTTIQFVKQEPNEQLPIINSSYTTPETKKISLLTLSSSALTFLPANPWSTITPAVKTTKAYIVKRPGTSPETYTIPYSFQNTTTSRNVKSIYVQPTTTTGDYFTMPTIKTIVSGPASTSTVNIGNTTTLWPVKHASVVEGDVILGGLMMVHSREDSITCGPIMPQGGIQALEAMLYTLDQVNKNQLLPNITLGAHILDDCDKDTYGLEMAVDFIKGTYQ